MKILNRKNLHNEFQEMIHKPLTLISAPMGFGKTTSLINFFQKKNYQSIWFSMAGETDEAWVFNRFIQQVAEVINDDGILSFSLPRERIEVYTFLDYLEAHLKSEFFIVFDDFEWNGKMGYFHQLIKYMCFAKILKNHLVVISREYPPNEFLELVYQSRGLLLNKVNFTFSKSDIRNLFRKDNITLNEKELTFIQEYSGGWIAAIQLLLTTYKRERNFYNLSNVNRLIETAYYDKLEPVHKEWMLKLSILKEFSFLEAEYLCESKEVTAYIRELEKDNCFIQRIDAAYYTIVPVLKDILTRELQYASIDLEGLYKRAGDYFLKDEKPLYALKMYLQSKDFYSIMEVFKKYNEFSFTDISPNLIEQIYDEMPEHFKVENPYIYLKWVCDNMTNVSPKKGMELLEYFEEYIVEHLPLKEKERAKGEYYFIRAFMHYNDARKMMADFHKAYDCFKGGKSNFAYQQMIATFGAPHILFLYFNKLGDFKAITEYIKEDLKYFIIISDGVNMGAENQSAAEYDFETGDYDHVEELAIRAYEQAKAYEQTSISICSLFLRGRLAFHQKNEIFYQHMIEQILEIRKSTQFPIIESGIDCSLAYLYALHGDVNKVADWIKEGNIESSNLLYQAKSVGYIAYGQYLLTNQYYKDLLAVCERLDDSYKETIHILGIVYGKLFKAIAYLNLYGLEKAYQYFYELIEYCKVDNILTPILERSRELKDFLKGFNPKDAYEEKLMIEMKKAIKLAMAQNTPYQLSHKEEEVMLQLIQNKKVNVIAEELEISTNTVQTHMKSIYRKLKVNTKISAIRKYESEILEKEQSNK